MLFLIDYASTFSTWADKTEEAISQQGHGMKLGNTRTSADIVSSDWCGINLVQD